MAKAGFTLYGARGKVGNLVARKTKKGTSLSEYKVPNNPRTNGQMRVRTAFGTITKAGAALADLVGISFQGKSSIKEARDAFNALNISKFSRALKNNYAFGTYAPKGISVLIPNEYIISDGSLRNATIGIVQSNFSTLFHEFSLGVGSYSAADLLQIIFGCMPGDQITVVGIRSGIPVEYNSEKLEILRDGQMVSGRIIFKDAAELAAITPVTITSETVPTTVPALIAACIASSIREGYQGLVSLFSNPNWYYDELGDYNFALDYDEAISEEGLVAVLGNTENVMALGYFRSHLNESGTQWLFSRCTLVCKDPVYDQETYDGEQPINYGYDYQTAMETYLSNSVRENTRYTETGGPVNQLGF